MHTPPQICSWLRDVGVVVAIDAQAGSVVCTQFLVERYIRIDKLAVSAVLASSDQSGSSDKDAGGAGERHHDNQFDIPLHYVASLMLSVDRSLLGIVFNLGRRQRTWKFRPRLLVEMF